MGPKKGAATTADGDEEDVSCDQFYRYYRKNCTGLEISVNPRIRAMYDEYVEEGKLISKVGRWMGQGPSQSEFSQLPVCCGSRDAL